MKRTSISLALLCLSGTSITHSLDKKMNGHLAHRHQQRCHRNPARALRDLEKHRAQCTSIQESEIANVIAEVARVKKDLTLDPKQHRKLCQLYGQLAIMVEDKDPRKDQWRILQGHSGERYAALNKAQQAQQELRAKLHDCTHLTGIAHCRDLWNAARELFPTSSPLYGPLHKQVRRWNVYAQRSSIIKCLKDLLATGATDSERFNDFMSRHHPTALVTAAPPSILIPFMQQEIGTLQETYATIEAFRAHQYELEACVQQRDIKLKIGVINQIAQPTYAQRKEKIKHMHALLALIPSDQQETHTYWQHKIAEEKLILERSDLARQKRHFEAILHFNEHKELTPLRLIALTVGYAKLVSILIEMKEEEKLAVAQAKQQYFTLFQKALPEVEKHNADALRARCQLYQTISTHCQYASRPAAEKKGVSDAYNLCLARHTLARFAEARDSISLKDLPPALGTILSLSTDKEEKTKAQNILDCLSQ